MAETVARKQAVAALGLQHTTNNSSLQPLMSFPYDMTTSDDALDDAQHMDWQQQQQRAQHMDNRTHVSLPPSVLSHSTPLAGDEEATGSCYHQQQQQQQQQSAFGFGQSPPTSLQVNEEMNGLGVPGAGPYVLSPRRSISSAVGVPIVNLAAGSPAHSVKDGSEGGANDLLHRLEALAPRGYSIASHRSSTYDSILVPVPERQRAAVSVSHRASDFGHAVNNPALIRQTQLSKHKLKATSRTSALLAGFAMVALVELDIDAATPKPLLISFAVITTLLVSVHLLALMMSTCMLPHMEASGSQLDSPHVNLRWYIETSWFFSTCLGLILFLLEICVVLWMKFISAQTIVAGIISTAILVPVFIIFIVFTLKFYRTLMKHHVSQFDEQLAALRTMYGDAELGQGGGQGAQTPLPTPTLPHQQQQL